MPDISMCTGQNKLGDCILRNSCYRYLATPSGFQSFFVAPFEESAGVQDCGYFIECRSKSQMFRLDTQTGNYGGTD